MKGLLCSNTARLSQALDDAFKARRVGYCNNTADREAEDTQTKQISVSAHALLI